MAGEDKPKTAKVRLLVPTRGAGVGDTVEVDSAAAKQLIADRQAVAADAKPQSKKSTANEDRRKAAVKS